MVRAKAQLLLVLVAQLKSLAQAVESYSEEIQRFFASMPAAKLAQTLPGGKSGTIVPMLWAELGDVKSRWQSFRLSGRSGRGPGNPIQRQEPCPVNSFKNVTEVWIHCVIENVTQRSGGLWVFFDIGPWMPKRFERAY